MYIIRTFENSAPYRLSLIESTVSLYYKATPTFVVSMDHNSERSVSSLKTLRRLGFAPQLIDAIDGREIILEDQNQNKMTGIDLISGKAKFKKKQFYEVYSADPSNADIRLKYKTSGRSALSPGELGCFMSHLKIYSQIIAEKIPYAFIFEDDLIDIPVERLDRYLSHLPNDFGILYLNSELHGLAKNEGEIFEYYSDFPEIVKMTSHRSTLSNTISYVISLNGAIALVNSVKAGINLPIDHHISSLQNQNKISIYFTTVTLFGKNPEFGSIISEMKRGSLKYKN